MIYHDEHYYMANALAADLAYQGHAVRIVSSMPALAPWMTQTLLQSRMIAELLRLGVEILPNATATS